MPDFDDGSIQFDGDQLDRVQDAERAQHTKILAVWDQLSDEAKNVCTFVHDKIMAGKFDGPNPHNHIAFLNQSRNIWVRQSGVRQEDPNA